MTDTEHEDNLEQDIADDASQARELAALFGEAIVEQARMVDIADLNMTDQMTAAIGDGIKHLKQLKGSPEQQRQWMEKQEAGLRLLLCLWIMDMGLLDKIK